MLFSETTFLGGFFHLQIEINVTFLCDKQFQKTALFWKELIMILNLAAATFYKVCPQMLFSETAFLGGFFHLQIEINTTFLRDKQFQQTDLF